MKNSTGGLGFDKGYLSQARTVLAFAPGHAARVVSGSIKLDEAYAEAKRPKAAASSTAARLAALRGRYPELADKGLTLRRSPCCRSGIGRWDRARQDRRREAGKHHVE